MHFLCIFLTKESPRLFTLLRKVLCCLPLPEAKDGVEPSFQDLQSNTFPLCYLAKPATSCAKVKRLFFLPRSLFFYICGGGLRALYDRRRVTREEGTNSPLTCSIFLFIQFESCKPLNYWLVQRRPEGGWLLLYVCSGEEHDEASVLVATMPI